LSRVGFCNMRGWQIFVLWLAVMDHVFSVRSGICDFRLHGLADITINVYHIDFVAQINLFVVGVCKV